ncbi:YhgE/Pip domain-containing protein [Enterococcus sp. AZ196]|uniref:YhgE/Pip domain-containing protein n=1 Tax=Enterococcus sp. AZ196 TaxID=2774659 RepID=UPI003D296640
MKVKKKFLIYAVVFFLSLIPILYSSLFLGAMMDPYGKVDQLPVALVGEKDNPIYQKLLENKLFDYKETGADRAKANLETGKVYAIITFNNGFPQKLKDFPRNRQSPTLTLTTSEGLNYSAAKLITTTTEQFVSKVNTGLSSQMIHQLNADQVPENVASVISLKHKDLHPVKNNGEGMAPYIFSLTLFVGGIFTNQFIMRALTKKKENYRHYWREQFLYPMVIALLQLLLLLLINTCFIHISITKPLDFMFFSIVVAAAFYSIIVAFNKLIPGIGSFIVLLLTMMQTSSSGGSYPILLSSPIFRTIHRFIPMTYSVNGFRNLISLDNSKIFMDYAALIIFIMAGQIGIYFSYQIHEKKAVH